MSCIFAVLHFQSPVSTHLWHPTVLMVTAPLLLHFQGTGKLVSAIAYTEYIATLNRKSGG